MTCDLRRIICWLSLGLMAGCPLTLRAQATQSSLLGTVFDASNAPIPGAKVVLRNGDADRALELLEPLLQETDASPAIQLTHAEALITHKGSSQKDKDAAEKILEAIKDKVPADEVSRVATLIDPKLPEKLGLPKAGGEAAPAKTPAKTPAKRRR